MSNRLLLRPIAMLLAVLVATPSAFAAGIEIERGERTDVAFRMVGECRASLSYDKRDEYLKFNNACDESLAEKGQELEGLLDALLGDTLPTQIESFDAGRMVVLSHELSQRVALAAHRSADWSAMLEARRALGPGDHGMANARVADLIDEGDLYREILAPFRARGLEPQSSGIQKVLKAPPQRTPIRDWLAEQAVTTDAPLPFDAIVWFRWKPRPAPSE